MAGRVFYVNFPEGDLTAESRPAIIFIHDEKQGVRRSDLTTHLGAYGPEEGFVTVYAEAYQGRR